PALAHRIAGAADLFLMPSRFEPSGRNLFISLRYGAVPVARAVGGLADTVRDYDPRTGEGNGFAFSEYNSMALFNAVQRGLELYKDREGWSRLRRSGMEEDHSWAASARGYEKLYREIAALRA
ncbi:MAG: glycosyltransferase, partial [bacterium]